MDNDRQLQVANDLEELSVVTMTIVQLLHMGQDDRKAHALVYALRHELTPLVRMLDQGYGTPKSADYDYALKIINSSRWNK